MATRTTTTPASQHSTSGQDLPPRRMRLGTRSCAECRRRKVRCIFPEKEAVCYGCQLHEVPCRPQQPGPRGVKRRRSGEDPDKLVLRRRLEELEGVVQKLCTAADPDAVPASRAQVRGGGAIEDATRRGGRASTSSALRGNAADAPAGGGKSNAFEGSSAASLSGREGTRGGSEPKDAPLIAMFKNAMLIPAQEAEGQPESLDCPSDWMLDNRAAELLRPITHLLPSSLDLRSILAETEKYWALWPPCFVRLSPSGPLHNLQQGSVRAAYTFVSHGLLFGDSTTIARVLLFLVLCVLQLPNDWGRRHASPSGPPRVLKAKYIQTARFLMCLSAERGGTAELVEAYVLQSRVYMDMGYPRKAWLTVRQALNMALILGLHRGKSHPRGSDPRAGLWPLIWQLERLLCAVLGLPTTLPDWHPGVVHEPVGPDSMHQMAWEVSRILGAVLRRDHSTDEASYAATAQVDREWQRCKKMMPEEFWAHTAAPNTAFPVIYRRHQARLQYWIAGQLIHLPYMHRAAEDGRFEINRATCLRACREMIRGYDFLRASSQHIVLCEFMDFKVFSAAAVIAIDLLSTRDGLDRAASARDWGLVGLVARCLRNTVLVKDCAVAGQGAQLLELLMAIRDGTYRGPEKYDATIPYFGRVQITCGAMQGTADVADVDAVAAAARTAGNAPGRRTHQEGQQSYIVPHRTQQPMSPTLQFSAAAAAAAAAAPFSYDFPFDLGSSDMELQCDWTMNIDTQSMGLEGEFVGYPGLKLT